uniref:Uncharacterized protein n=1 Tax=uncultured Bacillota bacterium TaxID=344338 RepID=A0A650EP33_9FIRM|nr:hypothetical protein Firmicute1046_1670 [uncultured Firmicutes bacterium]
MPTLQQKYAELLTRMRLPENAERYNELYGELSENDNDFYILRWEMDRKIPTLLKNIEKEQGAYRDFLRADCQTSIKKVEKLLTDSGWAK